MVIREVGGEIIYLAIDDTLILRASGAAPVSHIHYQHGCKPNLARYVRGQCWIPLAQIAMREKGNNIATPIMVGFIKSPCIIVKVKEKIK